jgi:hypothetical protein
MISTNLPITSNCEYEIFEASRRDPQERFMIMVGSLIPFKGFNETMGGSCSRTNERSNPMTVLRKNPRDVDAS